MCYTIINNRNHNLASFLPLIYTPKKPVRDQGPFLLSRVNFSASMDK